MKTLALFYPGCIEFEIMLACEILNRKYPVEVITPDGADHKGSNGMTFKAAGSIAAIRPDVYEAVLIPGGNPEILIGNEVLSQSLRKLFSAGAVMGAICAGPVVLAQAGLLKGRKIAHGYQGPQLEFLNKTGLLKDVELTDHAVIAENNIVTARPDAFIDFAVELACLADVIPREKVSFWKNYYRGDPQ